MRDTTPESLDLAAIRQELGEATGDDLYLSTWAETWGEPLLERLETAEQALKEIGAYARNPIPELPQTALSIIKKIADAALGREETLHE